MDHALFCAHDHGPYSRNRLAPAGFHVAQHDRAVRPELDDFAGGDIVHEVDADHGMTASASAASATTAAYDAGPGKNLLAGAGCFGPCPPWLFSLRLAVRLFAARSRIVLVVVLAARLFAARPRGVLVVVVAARGGRGCRRFLAGDAGLSLCRLACLAFERADAGGLLAQIGDKSLGHVLAARRLALDRHVTSKCALCRAQAAIYLAREAAEASELGLGGADQLGRIGESS